MKITTFFVSFLFLSLQISAQNVDVSYEPSAAYPYGQINPDAPDEVKDFAPMIGICDCKSVSRNPDQTWADTTNMIWKYKYVMNGTAVQDEVWRPDNNYAGSIRQYQADSAKWVVTYFSYPAVATAPGVWLGNKTDSEIILKKEQKAPNGTAGFSRLTFYDMNDDGFKWKGEWVDTSEKIVYPFWMIFCTKRK